jgi:hypothetical protein
VVTCLRVISRSPMSLLANLAVPAFSEEAHLKIRVLPQSQQWFIKRVAPHPFSGAWGRPHGRSTTLRLIVSLGVAPPSSKPWVHPKWTNRLWLVIDELDATGGIERRVPALASSSGGRKVGRGITGVFGSCTHVLPAMSK